MPTSSHHDEQDDLPPPGSRWGAGAHSVLPYLTKSLQAKPSSNPETREAARQRDEQAARTQYPGYGGR